MTRVMALTPQQVELAQLLVSWDRMSGQETDPAILAMAAAQTVSADDFEQMRSRDIVIEAEFVKVIGASGS